MQFLILHVDKLIGKDIPISVIIELVLTNLAYMVVLAAPMAVLVATLMAFGKFSELNELTALRSSGVNPFTIIRPVLFSSFFLFLFLAWFSNSILPEANNKARSLFIDIRLKKPGFELQPDVFYNGIEGYTFLVKNIDNRTDSLFDITLFQAPTKARNRAYIKAERGFLSSEGDQGLTLMLEDGEMLRYLDRNTTSYKDNLEKTVFSKYRLTFDLSDLEFSRSDPNRRSRSDRTMSAQAMSVVVDTLKMEIWEYQENSSTQNSYQSLGLIKEKPMRENKSIFNSFESNDSTLEVSNSEFLVLNNINNYSYQTRLLSVSQTRMDEQKSKFENVSSNILWRLKRVNKFLVEIYKKFSIPFACIVFVLLGAPIGIMTRRGNFGYAAIISAIILTVYWISIIQGEKLADRLFITPFWGMWSFNIIFSIVGSILIIRLTSGFKISTLLNKND
ncbi:MAG: LptF/LptG family permease [Balneolaceae bacterium]